MSALIHPENQKIIWNIINNNSYVNKFFEVNTNVSKDKWFRSIIEQFYTQNEGRNLSIEELNNLNKNVLSFMVKSINSTPAQQPTPKSYDTLNQNTYSPQIQTPPYIPNNITEHNNRQFEEKKQEYEQMYSKPVPPEVNFKEKEKDTTIENMGELINKHINEREKQLNEFKPQFVSDIVQAVPNSIKNETSFEDQLDELKDTVKKLQKKYDELTDNFTEKIQNQATIIDNLEKSIANMSGNSNKKNMYQGLNEQF